MPSRAPVADGDVQPAPTAASTHTATSELPRRLSSLTVPISFRRDTRCWSTRSPSFEWLTIESTAGSSGNVFGHRPF